MQRIDDFLTRIVDRATTRREESPLGRAYFNDQLPSVWDLNFFLAEGGSAEELAAEADRLQGDAGLAHRRVTAAGDHGTSVMDEFLELRWDAEPLVRMVRARAPDRAAEHRVEEVAMEEVAPVYRDYRETESFGADAGTLQALARRDGLIAEAGRGRFFAVREEGRVVSFCGLYTDGRTAQVEDVITARPHRGRGHARSVVMRAAHEASAAGADLVFLQAEREGWPRKFYERLGFDQVGTVWNFVRRPAFVAERQNR
ncbi:MAG: GNAT family N-acetyltransferase [Thermoleophilaceae bacterium]|nr:GNAT family N-acetyltransferase [Thermoleophilaceae bacterium]